MLRAKHISLALAASLLFTPAFAGQQPRKSPPPQKRPPAGVWLRKYQGASPEQQQKALKSDPQFQQLPPQRQQQLQQRLQNFNSLPPQQQDRMLERMQKFDTLSDSQKRRVEQLHQQMHAIPEDRRAQVRTAFQRLQQMPPDQRERVMNSPRFRGAFSPQEIDLIRGLNEVQGQTRNESAPPRDRSPLNAPE